MILSKSALAKTLYIILVFSFYFVPSRIPSFYTAYLLFLISLGSLFPLFMKRFHWRDVAIILMPYIICLFLTVSLFLVYGGDTRELRYVLLILPSIFVGLLIYSFVNEGYLRFNFGVVVVVVFGVSLAIFCFFQYFNALGVKEFLYPIINQNRGELYVDFGVSRALGTYGNPNEVAFVLGLSLLCLYSIRERFGYLLYFLLLSILVLGLITTGSRTVFVSLFLSFLGYFLVQVKVFQLGRFLFWSAVFGVAIFIFIINYFDVEYLTRRVSNFDSISSRFDYIWGEAYEFGLAHPIFGIGAGRDVLGSVLMPDSKWLVWWVQWGLFGVFSLSLYFLATLFYFGKKIFGGLSQNPAHYLGFLAVSYLIIYSFVVNFGIPETTPLVLVYIGILVLSVSSDAREFRVYPE